MRSMRRVLIAGWFAAAVVIALGGAAQAQVPNCTGNKVIDHAPYTCTDTKVITGITFDITLNVDIAGRAVVDYIMTPAQNADVPIALHSYTDINQDPRQFINGTIPAGQTTAQLVVPRIECGQLDIKAVEVTPGASAGNIAGPQVTWGDVCQVPATTTTTTTTVVPTSASPSSVSPASVTPRTIPATGTGGVVPWAWSLPVLAVAVVLIAVSRRRGAAQG